MHLSTLFGTEINLPRAQEIREMIHVIYISPRYSISCFKAPLFYLKITSFLFQQYNAEQINHLSKNKKQKTKRKNNCGEDVLSKHYFKSV